MTSRRILLFGKLAARNLSGASYEQSFLISVHPARPLHMAERRLREHTR